MITKGERTELRSIVRQQFKVLRSEIAQREAELLVEMDNEIDARFAADDQKWSVVQHRIHEAILEANREVNNALYDGGFQVKGNSEAMYISLSQRISQPQGDRGKLRGEGTARIHAQVKAALLQLDRREADLLRTLAVGAIESDEAREFLTNIPTVGELVPATRLAEIEAGLTSD